MVVDPATVVVDPATVATLTGVVASWSPQLLVTVVLECASSSTTCMWPAPLPPRRTDTEEEVEARGPPELLDEEDELKRLRDSMEEVPPLAAMPPQGSFRIWW